MTASKGSEYARLDISYVVLAKFTLCFSKNKILNTEENFSMKNEKTNKKKPKKKLRCYKPGSKEAEEGEEDEQHEHNASPHPSVTVDH